MSDYVLRTDDVSKFRLVVFETSDAHAPGFFKWHVTFLHPEDYSEVLISSGKRYMTIDQAFIEVVEGYFKATANAMVVRQYCETCIQDRFWYVKETDLLNEAGDTLTVTVECERCKSHHEIKFMCKIIGETESHQYPCALCGDLITAETSKHHMLHVHRHEVK